MAVLSKIRQLPIILIIVIIGIPLLTFVMDPSALSDFFNSRKINSVGEVAGESISRQEFAQALDSYRSQTRGRVSEMQSAKNVWNNLIREKIYKSQLDKAGITIGETDVMNKLYETQFIQNDPRFQTSGVFDKSKLKTFLATIKDEKSEEWNNWKNYISSVQSGIEKSTYDNLIEAGLGASLKEGETKYNIQNSKIDADFVFVPYSSIADSLVTVKKSEIEEYIKKHENDFKVDASRNISYVEFPIVASAEDKSAIKAELSKLINDHDEYSSVAKSNITVKGLKNTENYKIFFQDNKSDIPYNDKIQFKPGVPQVIVDDIFSGNQGDVFGPYVDKDFLKLTKIVSVIKIPDSVKARHILIPFQGSRSSTPDTNKTEEQAKQTADSIALVVKKIPSSFSDLAKKLSADSSNAPNGGDLGWFTYNTMVPEFRDYCFSNNKGDVGVVKTMFGFHIIKIDDQKTPKKAVKLATFARKIEASEKTENKAFQEAETLALEISKGKTIDEVAKEKNLKAEPVMSLKALDENIPTLGDERQIIAWTFEKDTKVGDYKRFDVDGGYIVVVMTGKTSKGLMPTDKAVSNVRPILMDEKKAEMIKDKLSGVTLDEIAKSSGERVRNVSALSLGSPTISGVGYEPKIAGAMLNAKQGEVYKDVVGDRGVYCFKVTKKELPVKLPNYDTERKRIAKSLKGRTYKIVDALKKSSGVEDNLSSFYGIE